MFDQPTRPSGSAARARLTQLAAKARAARSSSEGDRTPLGEGVEIFEVDEVGEQSPAHDAGARPSRPHGRIGAFRGLLSARAGRVIERWVPEPLVRPGHSVRLRWRRFAITAGLVAVLVIVAVASVVFSGQPVEERPPPLPVAAAKAGSPGAVPKPALPAPSKPDPVVVSVVGKVATPGLVTVPVGARVADAIRVAGGEVDDVDVAVVNLARRVVDGEQLYVGVAVPPPASQAGGPGSGASPASPSTPAASAGAPTTGAEGKVDLNSAGAEQLNSIDGVGEVTAQRILEWRTQHGRFGVVEQLREVDGIGEKRFSQMREHVTVS